MPNGADKNYWRLVTTIALYRRRFGDWPTEVRLSPVTLWSLAQLLNMPNFELLARRVRIRTTLRASLTAGSRRGHVSYDDVDEYPQPGEVDAAAAWLGTTVRAEYRHDS